MSDEELMSAVMAGDRAALGELVGRHQGPLLGYFFRMLDGDRAQAEDLVQETFFRLLRQRTYAPGRAFKPWLYAIATNLARDHLRAARTWPSGPGDDLLALLPDSAPGPDQLAVTASETRRVAGAMSTHIVTDVEAVAGGLVVMRGGSVLADTSPDVLLASAAGSVWAVSVDPATAARLQATETVSGMVADGPRVTVRVVTRTPPTGAWAVQPTLEDAYLLTVGRTPVA